jgi:hypothetical protein
MILHLLMTRHYQMLLVRLILMTTEEDSDFSIQNYQHENQQ